MFCSISMSLMIMFIYTEQPKNLSTYGSKLIEFWFNLKLFHIFTLTHERVGLLASLLRVKVMQIKEACSVHKENAIPDKALF